VIEAALFEQRFVVALLNHSAIINDQDLIGVPDGAEAMGDDEAGATGHQTQKGRLNALLGAGVHAAGGLTSWSIAAWSRRS
jgi:hypothetical protein